MSVIKTKTYKGCAYKKSLILNKKRAIINQIVNYLKSQNVIVNRNTIPKERDLIKRFYSEIGHEMIDNRVDCWDYLFTLYESSEFDILKSHVNRPDIPINIWRQLRLKVFEKWGNICLSCGSVENIAIDHIKPYSLYPELALEFNNLQPLCRSCNSKKSNKNQQDFRQI